MAEPDYYELLGVAPSASADEIKNAYRKAVRTAHPDAGGTPGLFRLITQAYETLHDPDARAAYDAALTGRGSANAAPDVDEADLDEYDLFDGPVDAGWGTETSWDADAEDDVKDFPRVRLLKWAAQSPAAHLARSGCWRVGPVMFVICLSALVVPGLIKPDAAEPDAFSWLLQVPPVTLLVAAVYTYLAWPTMIRDIEATVVPHSVVAIGLIAWPIAYGDVAKAAEWWVYVGYTLAWLFYQLALFIICLVNEADYKAARSLL